MTDSSRAVFLSYASQDAEAALQLCNALRQAGVEVWFDQSELRGGDAWDQMIRRQVKGCYLFVPIISANTQTRKEGYFRREWNIAVARTLDMAEGMAFLLPVVIDSTSDSEALVPEKFREVQWTRLPVGANTDAFVEHVRRLVSPEPTTPAATSARSSVQPTPLAGAMSTRSMPPASRSFGPWIVGGLLILAIGYIVSERFLASKHTAPAMAAPAMAAVPAAGDKSIAVLPFTDMSEKKDQEYFADGLSEELIDLLTKVPDLHVPARTSSFYFKGKPTPVPEIAKALNVAHVLEGSVRNSGNSIRITTHLIRVDSGYDIWSQSYDRDLKDIFKVQDEIAAAVVQALKAKLLTTSSTAIRTSNTEVYSLFLQGRFLNTQFSEEDWHRAIKVLQRAVSLDSGYAPAWAELAQAYIGLANYTDVGPARDHDMEAGRAALQKALALNQADAASHYLLALVKAAYEHDWAGAAAEMDSARRADPDLTEPYLLVSVKGCISGPCHEKYIRDISRDIERDPLNVLSLDARSESHEDAGELDAAESDLRRAIEISPDYRYGKIGLAEVLVLQSRSADALPIVQSIPESYVRRYGLALVYQALGRKAEADAALQELLAKDSEVAPVEIANVFAMRGDRPSALDWLQQDYDRKLYGIMIAKTSPLLRSLAHEPRFIALMQKVVPNQ